VAGRDGHGPDGFDLSKGVGGCVAAAAFPFSVCFWNNSGVMRVGGSGWAGVRMRRTTAVKACIWGLLCACSVAAQTSENASSSTLHVYTNLVQIPTLVLGNDRKPMARIDEQRFFVSLDGGRRLRATHARLEGDDPISVTILLDLSQSDPGVMLGADQAIASLAPLSLHAKDEVSIYALDCQLIRPTDQGATDAATLKQQVDLVLRQSQSRDRSDTKQRCQNPSNLWDSLVTIVQALSMQRGRRVILAVTDGVDRGSRNSWNALRDFAQTRSVAIFGLVQPGNLRDTQNEAPFNDLCQLSGGILLPTPAKDLGKQLAWAVTLIRGRYIVEFPRPVTTVGGHYSMDITISRRRAFIRAAGAEFPTDDPAILNDPSTVPPDLSRTPQLGNRKILTPH
jgi:hypothetical protein